MARPSSKSELPLAPAPPKKAVEVCSIADHHDLLPARIERALAEGWELLAIVAVRHTNEHAAYLKRSSF